jgi:hypothetical protein
MLRLAQLLVLHLQFDLVDAQFMDEPLYAGPGPLPSGPWLPGSALPSQTLFRPPAKTRGKRRFGFLGLGPLAPRLSDGHLDLGSFHGAKTNSLAHFSSSSGQRP